MTKFTNNLIDHFNKPGVNATIYKMWGGGNLTNMGDGIKFRVSKSPFVNYVYVRYLAGYDLYEIEFGALVGADYDVIDQISPVKLEDLFKTISRKVFNLNVVDEVQATPAQVTKPKVKKAKTLPEAA